MPQACSRRVWRGPLDPDAEKSKDDDDKCYAREDIEDVTQAGASAPITGPPHVVAAPAKE